MRCGVQDGREIESVLNLCERLSCGRKVKTINLNGHTIHQPSPTTAAASSPWRKVALWPVQVCMVSFDLTVRSIHAKRICDQNIALCDCALLYWCVCFITIQPTTIHWFVFWDVFAGFNSPAIVGLTVYGSAFTIAKGLETGFITIFVRMLLDALRRLQTLLRLRPIPSCLSFLSVKHVLSKLSLFSVSVFPFSLSGQPSRIFLYHSNSHQTPITETSK